MNRVRTMAMAPSVPAEQSITTTFHVEVMNDLDDGQPTLLGASDANLGDLQVVTADQVIAKGLEQHRLIDKAIQLALDYEAATGRQPATEPRAWTVTDSKTGLPLNVTCMSGCDSLHAELGIGSSASEEISCAQYDRANTVDLPIGCGSTDGEEWATLSVEIKSDPVHPDPAKRIPHAAVEVTEDHYIEDLDPDGLAVVIDKLSQRLAGMRVRHADLIRIRAEHLGRSA